MLFTVLVGYGYGWGVWTYSEAGGVVGVAAWAECLCKGYQSKGSLSLAAHAACDEL